MSDLTPDEEREAKWEEYGKAEGLVWDMPFSSERRAFEAGWDAHDAEVARNVLRDAADGFMARLPDGTSNGRAYNSYTVARMLRDRADQIGESE